MMSKEGDQGVVAKSKRPIDKLDNTNSSIFTHLNLSSQANLPTPRYELN
jgi:hypothetical protein